MRRYAAILCWILCVCLSACSANPQVSAPPSATPAATSALVPQEGGSITIAAVSLEKNPLMSDTQDQASMWGLVFEGLFQLDENRKPTANLAENWEVTDDGKTWLINLRRGVQFHHGLGEFSAADVIFTLDEIQKPDSAMVIYRDRLQGLASWTETGTYTVELRFEEPVWGVLQGLTFPVLCKRHYEGRLSGIAPVGTGPYEVETWNASSMTLSINEKWWRTKPHIPTIQVVAVKDAQAAMAAFNNKKIDVLFTRDGTAGLLPQEHVITGSYITRQYEFIGINFRTPLLADKAFRQALARAIDRKALIQGAWLNKAVPVDIPFAPDSFLYDIAGYAATYEYNAEEATALLESMGWKDPGDHILENNGRRAELVLIVNDNDQEPMRENAARALVKQLAQIGILIELRVLPWAEYLAALETGDYDLMMGGYDLKGPDLSFALHSQNTGEGGSNVTKYISPVMDQALEQLQASWDQQQLEAAAKTLQVLLLDELPYISLCFRTGTWLARDTLHQITPGRDGDWYRYISDWFYYDDPSAIQQPTPQPTQLIPDLLAATPTPSPTIPSRAFE